MIEIETDTNLWEQRDVHNRLPRPPEPGLYILPAESLTDYIRNLPEVVKIPQSPNRVIITILGFRQTDGFGGVPKDEIWVAGGFPIDRHHLGRSRRLIEVDPV